MIPLDRYTVLSVGLHAAILAALLTKVELPWNRQPPLAAPIQAVIIDASTFETPASRAEAARVEQERVQRVENQRREAAVAAARREEQQRQERIAADIRERDRKEAEQREKDRLAAAEAERKKKEAEDARLAEEKRKEDERKRQAEAAARAQAQREAELQAQLAVEQERQAAERAGLLAQYIRDITNTIEGRWNRPPSVAPGLECVITVQQTPTGTVARADIGRCNGDQAVVRSIEAAVLKGPLPPPPTPALFERNLVITFKPED